jgi:predicted nucleic acid-binding protein
VIAVDTNFLVYARRAEAIHHIEAKRLLAELSEGVRPWAIPWPCIYEFLRVVTHPRVFRPPTQLGKALEELDHLFDSPAIALLGEGPAHRAHIAALLREHAVREFWTTDKDFHRFPGIPVRNPFTTDEVHETRVRYKARRGAQAGRQ